MSIKLRVDKQDLDELASIRDLGEENLARIIEKLDGLDPIPLRPSDLRTAVESVLPDSESEAAALVRQLLILSTLRAQHFLGIDEVLSGLRFGIENAPEEEKWKTTELHGWETIQPSLSRLLEVPAVQTASKAYHLTHEYANLCRTATILTDIRPVFSENADAVRAALISHTLRLNYFNPEGSHSLSIAMDERDVRELQQACERAIRKAATASRFISNATDIPVLICGEDEDATG